MTDLAQTMKLICEERINKSRPKTSARGIGSISSDVEKLLGPKSYEELEVLEKQIKQKLASGGPIDVDYWEHLLRSLQGFKAKARLRKVSQAVVASRLAGLRKQQVEEAAIARSNFFMSLRQPTQETSAIVEDRSLDPEMVLKLSAEDKTLVTIDERSFLSRIVDERRRIRKLGYVPYHRAIADRSLASHQPSSGTRGNRFGNSGAARLDEDSLESANAQFQREVARGIQDDEEVFATEESVAVPTKEVANGELRKPKFFNRVQLGYEWNKYNQTHYDHDNPPPKVVQGYRFNVFYPNLADKSKAPTYKIEREGGRKRGQTFAPAGEEDTCVIRFIAGPPYQDIAFRIIDKEWDYSAKRERGFRSTFENVRRPASPW